MAIQDEILINTTKLLNGETANIPSSLAVSTDSTVTTLSTAATIIPGEIGDRISLTGSRTNNVLSLSGLRSSASVITTSTGDTLAVSGIHAGLVQTDVDDKLMIYGTHPGTVQTTNFDIEFSYDLSIVRG